MTKIFFDIRFNKFNISELLINNDGLDVHKDNIFTDIFDEVWKI